MGKEGLSRDVVLPAVIQVRPHSYGKSNLGLEPWPGWVEDAAFAAYIKCGRNCRAAKELLDAEWDDLVPFTADEETGEITKPSLRLVPLNTIKQWRKRHDWDIKATTMVATQFHLLNAEDLATLVLNARLALTFQTELLLGQHDDANPQLLAVKAKAVETILQSRGLGTFGTRDRTQQAPKLTAQSLPDFSSMTEQEISRYTLQAVKASKADIDERKR